MHQARNWLALRLALFCADACAMTVAFVLAFLIAPATHGGSGGPHDLIRASLHIAVYVAGWLLLLTIYRLYEPEYLLDGFQQYARVAQASTAGLLFLVGAISLLDGDTLIPRSWLILSWAFSVITLGLVRFLLRRIVWRQRRQGRFRSRVLILGAGEDGLAIAHQIEGYAPGAAEVVGYLDEYSAVGTRLGDSEVLGEPLSLARVAKQTHATDAIILPQAISWESLQALLQTDTESWGIQRLWLAPAFRDLLTTGMSVHQRGSLPLLSVQNTRIGGLEGVLKRGLDLLLVLVALPIVLPLSIAVTAWLAWWRHTAPITRTLIVGHDRRRFTLYAFPPLPELRRLHLWRLPALVNVLKGDMSLVGPRPVDASLALEYRRWQIMLASVHPGLTGPWWLLSGSQHLSIPTEVAVDLAYIRNYTIWSDLRFIALTARKLCKRLPLEDAGPDSGPLDELDTVAPDNVVATVGGNA